MKKEWYVVNTVRCRCTVTPKVHVTLCERVLVTVGSQIVQRWLQVRFS